MKITSSKSLINFGASFAIAATLSALAATGANAQTAAVTIPNNTGTGGGSFTLGFEFSVNSATTVTALGVFDDLGNGLAGSDTVGIFQVSNQSLIASATVSNANSLFGTTFYRYASIAPTVLLPGVNYIIAGENGTDAYPFANPSIATLRPGINYITNVFVNGSTFAYPTSIDTSTVTTAPAYPFANFLTGTASASAPEPTAVALLFAGATTMAGLIGRRRRLS